MKKHHWTNGTIINLSLLGIFVLVGLLSPFLANDQPVLCRGKAGYRISLFLKVQPADCDPVIQPLIRYKYNNIDPANASFVAPGAAQNLAPGQQRHWLGTDQLGRDVASGMIHGSRIALITGGVSMSIALIIGLFFGLLGGYFGNDGWKIKRYSLILFGVGVLFMLYFFSYMTLFIASPVQLSIFFLVFFLLELLLFLVLKELPWLKQRITVPLDLLFSNFIEIFQSLPGSFIILILVSLFTKASIFNVILVIGLLRWPMIARYVRAEMLRIKAQRYIEASRAIGLSDWRIIIRHALPATLTPVIVAVAFGFSSAILLESTLSFLGIGLPADHVSFGSMLSEARKNYEAWWLAVFPGLAIFILVYVFNYLGDRVSRMIEKK
jgi:peptide/nickel transport system permease protein